MFHSRAALAGTVFSAAFLLSACGPSRVPQPTVDELLDDRVALDGVLMKCNRNGDAAAVDPECDRARVAVERLARESEEAEAAKRSAEFEQSREKLRLAQERQRERLEEASKIDPYNLPVVPVDGPSPTPEAKPPQGSKP